MLLPPQILILAGSNGAGKSTAANTLIGPDFVFVNADEVAKHLPGYPSAAVDREAGRLVLEQMNALEQQRASFAVETTLASRGFLPRVKRLQQSGYLFRLVYLWTPSANFAVQRVAERVRAGGHNIPEETIRRRYKAGLENFFRIYKSVADFWAIYANTDLSAFHRVAEGEKLGNSTIHDPDLWESIQRSVGIDE